MSSSVPGHENLYSLHRKARKILSGTAAYAIRQIQVSEMLRDRRSLDTVQIATPRTQRFTIQQQKSLEFQPIACATQQVPNKKPKTWPRDIEGLG